MSRMVGIDRNEAAAWAYDTTGYLVTEQTLRYWERQGVLRAQRPGRRNPCSYGLDDLVKLRAVTELRRDGAPLQRVRKALRWLAVHLPDIKARPGAWRLAVTSTGEVVRIESDKQVLQLSRQGGQLAFLDAGLFVREAKRELTCRGNL